MARIEEGNNLADTKIQPGWKLTDDGYGLRTLNCTYKVDRGAGFDFNRGEAFPLADYSYCKLHKQTATFDALGLMTQNCDYIGISPDVNGGEYTIPQVGSANGLTSENITAHPNFFTANASYPGGVIAGTSYAQSDLAPVVTYIDDFGKPQKRHGYLGVNGSCFEGPSGGRFIGFVDPAYPNFFGKTQYLAQVTSFSGVIYLQKTSSYVPLMKNYLVTSSSDNTWDGNLPPLIPEYLGTSFVSADGNNQLLLSQVNFDDFGELVKVAYEIRFSNVGWDDSVYITAAF
jgi:hypothetical protein